MNKQAIANTLKSLQKTMRKHSPAILTGIGIAGMAAAAVMAVRATPKALRMVDDREIEDEKRLTTSEIVKTTWEMLYSGRRYRRMLRRLHHWGQLHQRTAERGPGHGLYHFRDCSEGVQG